MSQPVSRPPAPANKRVGPGPFGKRKSWMLAKPATVEPSEATALSCPTRVNPLYSNTCWKSESFVLPSTYGRFVSGTKLTTVIQLNETVTATSVAAANCRRRRRRRTGAATSHTSARAGRTSHASSILAWKASPTQKPASNSHQVLALASAVTVASAASTSKRMRSESEMLPRLSATVTGLIASTAEATIPAIGPAVRSTTRYSTSTVRTPSTTCGSTIAQP